MHSSKPTASRGSSTPEIAAMDEHARWDDDDPTVPFDPKGDRRLTPDEIRELKRIAQSSFVIRRIVLPFIVGVITAGAGLFTVYKDWHK